MAGTWAAALALAPAAVLAQSTPDSTSNTPATDAVGPRELRDFSLPGTATKPADQPAPARAASQPARTPQASPRPAPQRRTAEAAPPPMPKAAPAKGRAAATPPLAKALDIPPPSRASVIEQGSSPSASASAPAPPLAASAPASPPPSLAQPTVAPTSDAASFAVDRRMPIWPWLLAGFAVVAGGFFLLFRRRSRLALAGGPNFDLFLEPDPAPAPRPAPAPVPPPAAAPAPAPRAAQPAAAPSPRAEPAVPGGIVSTRLRPWVEIAIQPLRCIFEDAGVTVELELDLFNSGSAPARGILVEATVVNAGPRQEQDIETFFSRPGGEGERIDAIGPLQRLTMRTRVVAPIDSVQIFAVRGRELFVPLIAFNALYRWAAGEGQTSTSYLLGRDTKKEKLAPFRADLGPRIFRGLAARPLPTGVRR